MFINWKVYVGLFCIDVLLEIQFYLVNKFTCFKKSGIVLMKLSNETPPPSYSVVVLLNAVCLPDCWKDGNGLARPSVAAS